MLCCYLHPGYALLLKYCISIHIINPIQYHQTLDIFLIIFLLLIVKSNKKMIIIYNQTKQKMNNLLLLYLNHS